MALKINFVDEVGTNLNRYNATNTKTGETYTFDLARAGNISQNGTRLTAELMNQIIEELNRKSRVTVKVNSDNTIDLTIEE